MSRASEQSWRARLRRLGRAAVMLDLGDDSIYLAEEMIASAHMLGEEERLAVAVAVVLLGAAERQGSTCLPLSGPGFRQRARAVCEAAEVAIEPARIGKLLRSLADPSRPDLVRLVGQPGEAVPLIVHDNSLASHRMHATESRLADALAERLARPLASAIDVAGAMRDVSSRPVVVGGQAVTLSDEQRAAVELAVSRSLAVVSGGPGTGKTAICATVCRMLARLGTPPSSIALCAPTGKAANRVDGSIRAALAGVGEPSAEDRALAEQLPTARTVHRLLGYDAANQRFRHHARAPLPARVVIVDEASMLDLALMERLVRALPADAALILFGDADQLPSVEAGAVLRDLAEVARNRQATCRLSRSYRLDQDDPRARAVLETACSVRDGDWQAVTRVVPASSADQLRYAGIERYEPGDDGDLDRLVHTWLDSHLFDQSWIDRADTCYEIASRQQVPADIEHMLAVVDRARILCATRRGPWGVEDINRRCKRMWAQRLGSMTAGDLLPGQPVVMRANDYGRELFNGDSGVAIRAAVAGRPPQMWLAFPGKDGIRLFEAAPLRPRIDPAFALTVHQSQGSEYQHVAVVLPLEDRPIVTRELIYTGLTRAKASAALIAPTAVLKAAIKRAHQRHSGLADRLTSR